MSKVRIRSFTVPRGANFVCVPNDGGGPVIADAGCQVTIVVAENWETSLIDAIRQLMEQPKDE